MNPTVSPQALERWLALLEAEVDAPLRRDLAIAAGLAPSEGLARGLAPKLAVEFTKMGPAVVPLTNFAAALLPAPERLAELTARAANEALASFSSTEAKYEAACRTALVHACFANFDDAFEALRRAAAVNDSFARHHHVYGLIHGLAGNLVRARFELEKARLFEPYADAAERIGQALAQLDAPGASS